jgi:hypothetical protein
MLVSLSDVQNDRIAEEIERIVEHISDTLFYKMDHDIIAVSFELDDELGVDGFCMQDDEYEYTIQLHSKIRGEELHRTIIHELTHVWQYVVGYLEQDHVDGLGPRMYWMGEDHTSEEYENRPWEKQAHEIEETLYHKYNTNVA